MIPDETRSDTDIPKSFFAALTAYALIAVLVWAWNFNRIPENIPRHEQIDQQAACGFKGIFWPIYFIGKAALKITK